MRDALDLLLSRIAKVLQNLTTFALKWKGELRTLTHIGA